MEATFGARIREVRKSFGLTQEEFSKRSGISLSSIKRYEANERQPNMDQIDKMAAAVGLTREFFMWSFDAKLQASIDQNVSENEKIAISVNPGKTSFTVSTNSRYDKHFRKYMDLDEAGKNAVDSVTDALSKKE